MLSITKINAAKNQGKKPANGAGYAHYLGAPTTRERGDFDDYARGGNNLHGPQPFWAGKGSALLGLDAIAEAEQVDRLARGFHPLTGAALVKGAGDGHVMGLDMTFSAPKDFSAVFAGADSFTRTALIECLQQSATTALSYAETAVVTRHGRGGLTKQVAEAAVAACYTHFSSRALDPQLHVHAFLFNLGKRRGCDEWSALEMRPQFERKLATGVLFRAELAFRLRALGFDAIPAGPYFAIRGIEDSQRSALSTRSRQIADYMRECGLLGFEGAAAREVAALNTRGTKAEPPLPELIERFETMARKLGITPQSIALMRAASPLTAEPFSIDRAELLKELMASQSCSTAHEALAAICAKAMGRWSAAECLKETDRFMSSEGVVRLGVAEGFAEVFTSKATQKMEARVSQLVGSGELERAHQISRKKVDLEFDRLESELEAAIGVKVSLEQQRQAALYVCAESGQHAFVEGWAGVGKTTMLKAAGRAYQSAGFSPIGCCQSAAAAQNLERETGIPSRTIASLMLALRQGRARLHERSILVLDEAGMVGSREFSALQEAILEAGGKLVCVGDPKQLQPIEGGGIFSSLMRQHGKAEISSVQRQRTDFEPILRFLDEHRDTRGALSAERLKALREAPEEARAAALESLCSTDPTLARAFERWRGRFDFEWMRQTVQQFAKGDALAALQALDAKDKLRIHSTQDEVCEALIAAWARDKTPLASKAIVAATRAEVARLNDMARAELIKRGRIDSSREILARIKRRDGETELRYFAPGDRLAFTLNDRGLGVANGVSGVIRDIENPHFYPTLVVELDEANERGETIIRAPVSFACFDHAYCATNHRSQGRTFDAAYVLANPSMCDREWTYVATSRSRFSTTVFVNAALLGLIDPESHQNAGLQPKSRAVAIEALAARMRRSGAKGTSLDYSVGPDILPAKGSLGAPTARGLLRPLSKDASHAVAAARAILARFGKLWRSAEPEKSAKR